jgi:hypothetical protein
MTLGWKRGAGSQGKEGPEGEGWLHWLESEGGGRLFERTGLRLVSWWGGAQTRI